MFKYSLLEDITSVLSQSHHLFCLAHRIILWESPEVSLWQVLVHLLTQNTMKQSQRLFMNISNEKRLTPNHQLEFEPTTLALESSVQQTTRTPLNYTCTQTHTQHHSVTVYLFCTSKHHTTENNNLLCANTIALHKWTFFKT